MEEITRVNLDLPSDINMAPYIGLCAAGAVVVYIINAWLLGRIFAKAGVARWRAWIPIVNTWTLFKIGGRNGANIFLGIAGYLLWLIAATCFGFFGQDNTLFLAPVLGMIAAVLAVLTLVLFLYKFISALWNVQKKLHKPGPFIILYVINLIAPLWVWILALDHSKWNDKKGRPMIK